MSDLISRSELIKFFKEHMRTAKDFREIIINIIPTIENHPTAYDVNKVVEEFDEYITKIVGRKSALYHTIMKIVKRGGKHDI